MSYNIKMVVVEIFFYTNVCASMCCSDKYIKVIHANHIV